MQKSCLLILDCKKDCPFDVEKKTKYLLCPELQSIEHLHKNGQTFYARRPVPYKLGAEYVYPARQAIEVAHEIVKYCDHYKTR